MTAGWKEYFSGAELEEGVRLCHKKAVKGFIATKDSCMARVLADRVYDVSIRGLSEGRLSMGCNCLKAQEGKNCAHMAAVLLFRQQEKGIDLSEKEVLFGDETEGYLEEADAFFQIRKLTADFKASPDLKSRANELIEQGRMRVDFFKMHYGSGGRADTAWAEFQALYRPNSSTSFARHPGKVYFCFSRDRFTDIRCENCRSYLFGYRKHEICVHEMAAIYLLQDYIRQYNPGDATDERGDRFLSSFSRLVTAQEDGRQGANPIIRLIPRLIQDAEGLTLSFRIGVNQFYVVKDLTNLVDLVEEGGSLPLGKRDTLHFQQETFHESSREAYSLIRSQVDARLLLEKRLSDSYPYYKQSSFQLAQGMPLEGDAADFLYRYLEAGRSAELRDKTRSAGYTSLRPGKHIPKIRLRIDPLLNLDKLGPDQLDKLYHRALAQEGDAYAEIEAHEPHAASEMAERLENLVRPEDLYRLAGGTDIISASDVQGLIVTGDLPVQIRGREASYAVYDGKMVRFSREDEESLMPLTKAAEGRSLRLFIGKKHLAEFYYRVLPRLEENPRIAILKAADYEAMGILPEEAEFSFRLDIEDGLLLADGKVSYGDRTFPLLPQEDRRDVYDAGRDPEQEARALAALQADFPFYERKWASFCREATDDAIYEILDSGIARLKRLGRVEGSEAFRKLSIHNMPRIRVGVSVTSNLMDLEISTEDMSTGELMELLDSYRRKKAYHKLRSGAFIRLDQEDSMKMLVRLMDDTGVKPEDFTEGKMRLPLYRALYINQMLEDHDAIAADRDRGFRKLIKGFKTVAESDYDVPRNLSGVLRKYQTYGYKWIRTLAANHFGGILADDMGLGKTLQMIAVLAAEKRERSEGGGEVKRPSLIVCPASLVYNWQEELTRFAPELLAVPVTGMVSQRKEILADWKQTDVLISSYDLLKRDIAIYRKMTFDFQVLDEAQYIKNPGAAVSKAVKIIHSDHRFALTGTPIENRLSELWSIFDFLMPGFLYRYETFRTDFELPIAREENEAVMARLRRMTGPFILRRLKKDVLKDLPAKIEEVRYARLEGEQRKLYDARVIRMRSMLAVTGEVYNRNRIQVLAELTKIRQICCDPSILMEGYKGKSAKREACLDLITSAIDGGHKMLVFSQFTSMLALLEEDLAREGISFYKITGATSKEDRLRLVHAFNEDETPVFLISLKAGGTGLNLTGADLVIHYDPWWNLAAQNQATDRAHRIGQTRDVSVFRLIAKDTIEDRILDLQEKKKDLADAILSGRSDSLGRLSQEELLDLLS